MSKINFKIDSYEITEPGKLIISGQKLPPPSKRITLHQKNIKIISANIIYKHKKGSIDCEVTRINQVKSFGEIRLHTSSILYPGSYELTVQYSGELDENALMN